MNLTAALVHEIKTPLVAISLPAELSFADAQDVLDGRVQGQEAAAKIKKRMTVIMDRAKQASQRLDGIHVLMGLNSRNYKSIALAKPIESAYVSLQDLFLRHKININTPQIPDVRVNGSLEQLEIVFSNLLKNAAESMEQVSESKRQVTLVVEQKRKQIVIRIHDQGPGFAVESVRLFTPFFSTKSTAERGIGLFLCRQIIHAHGGTIEAHNHPEGGAEFEIRLPLAS